LAGNQPEVQIAQGESRKRKALRIPRGHKYS